MTHGSLFSGLGAFDLAAEWMDWRNEFHCELNEYCRGILKQRFPDSESYGDIKKTDFTIHGGRIDVLTGGDPCQGNSVIGKREGANYRDYLWPENLRATKEVLPRWLVNENVAGSISNGILDRKIEDLEGIGYTVWPPLLIPASYVGGWHNRKRVFLIAHSLERRLEGRDFGSQERQRKIEIGSIEALVENKNGIVVPKSEFLRETNGLPYRVERIKALGNSIVPQICYQIFKAIEQYERQLDQGK